MLVGVHKAVPREGTPLNPGEPKACGDASSPSAIGHQDSNRSQDTQDTLWAITALTTLLDIFAGMSGSQSLHHGCF